MKDILVSLIVALLVVIAAIALLVVFDETMTEPCTTHGERFVTYRNGSTICERNGVEVYR